MKKSKKIKKNRVADAIIGSLATLLFSTLIYMLILLAISMTRTILSGGHLG